VPLASSVHHDDDDDDDDVRVHVCTGNMIGVHRHHKRKCTR